MGFTYPPVISDSSLYNPRFYPSLGSDGTLTYDFAQTLYLSKNDYRMSYLSAVIPGSATSGSAIVLDEDLSLSGLGSISCTALTVGGVAVGTLPTFLTGITPGTAENNKALVLDGSGSIATISSLTATSLNATAYKQGGTIYDLSLVNRLALTTLGTAEGSKALVLDSTSSARGVASLEINQTATLSTSSTMDAFGLILRRNTATTGDTCGMAFAITNVSSISTTGGASIIFTRSGSQGIGTLSLNLRTSSASAQSPLSEVLKFNTDGSSTFAYSVSAPSITLSTGGVGMNLPNLKFWNATTSLYDNFNHAYYLNVVEGGAVAQKALVVDINKDIGSIRDLDAVNINGSTKVSGTLGDFGSISIGGTSIITSSRHIQNIGNITNSGTMNAGAGYQLNGATLVDSSQNVFAASVIADYAQLDKAAGTAYSSTMKSNEYNLALSQASNVSATFAGLAFHVDTSGLSVSTPGACIISQRDSTTAYDGSSISFCTKGTAGASSAPTKRMTITKTGSINFGSTNSTDGDLILLKAAGSPLFRFGSELSVKNAISIQWNYLGAGLDTNRLSFDVYGTSNALAITAASRVGIGTGTPACGLDVVNYAAISMTGPLATGTTSAYTVNRSGTYTDNVSIYCREALMVGIRGIYTGSDRRVKENIDTIPPQDGVKFVRDIDPKIYDLKGFDKRQVGYISQDLMQDYSALISLLPDPNMTIEQEGDVDGAFLSMSYERVPAFLHAALKSVLDRLDNQQRQIDELRAIISE
jgi:hypothetical protein